MPTYRQKAGYLDTEEGIDIEKALQELADNPLYNTVSSYSTDTAQYPDHSRTFVQKHMHYLNIHPKLDALTYISNLRLMTRIR